MFSLLYGLSLCVLALVALPKLLWQWFVLGKYRESLRARLGIALPSFSPKKGQEVIWIHAVSMGETRAVIPLFHRIRQAYPEAAIVISTTTETGNAEARRSMPDAHAHFFLPLDFSWAIRRIVERIRPSNLIMCESDFWYHLLTTTKKQGARIALVNGKVSERSCNRFRKVPFFTRRIFANFDILCVQSQRYCDRFISMGVPAEKLLVTGNLKFDAPAKKGGPTELQLLRETLKIAEDTPVLVIGSTHAQEEDWLISAADLVWKKIPKLKVLLVPRHPERFNEVAHLIKERGFTYRRYSEKKNSAERLILIDAMGLLNQCYQIADAAIVGGSYVSHIGGHNIFEPVMFGVPVFFGPHMHGQPDLKELILTAHAGKEVKIDALPEALIEILENPAVHHQYAKACEKLAQSLQGSTLFTFQHIFNLKRN
jgi:3-deoxy-D-manno-octulosonic-acid transferase